MSCQTIGALLLLLLLAQLNDERAKEAVSHISPRKEGKDLNFFFFLFSGVNHTTHKVSRRRCTVTVKVDIHDIQPPSKESRERENFFYTTQLSQYLFFFFYSVYMYTLFER